MLMVAFFNNLPELIGLLVWTAVVSVLSIRFGKWLAYRKTGMTPSGAVQRGFFRRNWLLLLLALLALLFILAWMSGVIVI